MCGVCVVVVAVGRGEVGAEQQTSLHVAINSNAPSATSKQRSTKHTLSPSSHLAEGDLLLVRVCHTQADALVCDTLQLCAPLVSNCHQRLVG